MNSNQSIRLKTIFIGDSGVGKTSLLSKQSENVFREEHLTTIGCDFKIKNYTVGKINVKMQFWDTAGQQRFRTISRNFYKGSHIICVCFSLNDRKSFDNLPLWVDQLQKYPQPSRQTFLIGCKSDLDNQVPTDQILLFAEKRKLIYFQTSSKTGQGINQAFNNIVLTATQKEIQRSLISVQKNETKIEIIQKQKPVHKKGCC